MPDWSAESDGYTRSTMKFNFVRHAKFIPVAAAAIVVVFVGSSVAYAANLVGTPAAATQVTMSAPPDASSTTSTTRPQVDSKTPSNSNAAVPGVAQDPIAPGSPTPDTTAPPTTSAPGLTTPKAAPPAAPTPAPAPPAPTTPVPPPPPPGPTPPSSAPSLSGASLTCENSSTFNPVPEVTLYYGRLHYRAQVNLNGWTWAGETSAASITGKWYNASTGTLHILAPAFGPAAANAPVWNGSMTSLLISFGGQAQSVVVNLPGAPEVGTPGVYCA